MKRCPRCGSAITKSYVKAHQQWNVALQPPIPTTGTHVVLCTNSRCLFGESWDAKRDCTTRPTSRCARRASAAVATLRHADRARVRPARACSLERHFPSIQ